MVKHTQTIRRQLPKNCLSVFDHFVELGLKGLTVKVNLLPITFPTTQLTLTYSWLTKKALEKRVKHVQS